MKKVFKIDGREVTSTYITLRDDGIWHVEA